MSELPSFSTSPSLSPTSVLPVCLYRVGTFLSMSSVWAVCDGWSWTGRDCVTSQRSWPLCRSWWDIQSSLLLSLIILCPRISKYECINSWHSFSRLVFYYINLDLSYFVCHLGPGNIAKNPDSFFPYWLMSIFIMVHNLIVLPVWISW